MSPQRKLGCGFTFEVQRSFGECLGGGLEVEAFSRGVIVGVGELTQLGGSEAIEIGACGQVSSEASDGIFDAAFLPGAMGVAEVGFDAELLGEQVVEGELGSVVDGEGGAAPFGEGTEQACDGFGGGIGLAVWGSGDEDDPGGAFVEDEDRLAGCGKAQVVGFPMADAL